MIDLGLIIFSVIQSILMYGLTLGYFNKEFAHTAPHYSIAIFEGVVGLFCPILGLILVYLLSEFGKHGFEWT